MDTIDFAVRTLDTHTEVTILINGRSLLDYVREIELPFATLMGEPDLAGNYVGVPPDLIFPPSHHLLGNPTWDDASVVLRCPCLECPPESDTWLRVRITITESVVIWHDFDHPVSHCMLPRPWTYERLGPFTFDVAQYRAALAHHGSAIRPGDTVHGTLFLDPIYGWALRILWEPAYLPLIPEPVTLLLGDHQTLGQVYNLRRCWWEVLPLNRPDRSWWILRSSRLQRWRVLLPADPEAIATWLTPWIDVAALEAAWLRSALWDRIVNPHLEGDAVPSELGLSVEVQVIEPGRIYQLQPDPELYALKKKSMVQLQDYLARR